MTIQSDDVLDNFSEYIVTEVLETLASREVEGTDDLSIAQIGRAVASARDARFRLLPLMEEAANLGDIDLLLEIERSFLQLERDFLGEARLKMSSLDKAIEEIEAAMVMLHDVRDHAYYQRFDQGFSLDKNRKHGVPIDQAQQFFDSHRTRLSNMERWRLDRGERELLDARAQNMQEARKLYTQLQQQALTTNGINEPRALYAPSRLHLVS